jgi:UDP-N-acetylmuramate--alanine ligase
VGIGGIGMSALARFASLKGLNVFGYDKTETKLTKLLVAEGIHLNFTDAISALPMEKISTKNTLVVYTPAISVENNLLRYFINNNYQVIKRSKFLGAVTEDTLCLAVAGTHGKTTTSAILGHLMVACDMPVTAFLGGIAENYKSNFISNGTQITVVEADEFDRSFLTLSPDIACITSMDADHLDIYGNATEIENSFKDFAALVQNSDHLLFKKGLPLKGQDVAIEDEAHFKAENVRIENGGYTFDLKTPTETLVDLVFYLPGHHNLHNAVTALGMALLAGTPVERLPEALASFKGVERRFSYKIKTSKLVLIDDYAHHPTELNALHQAVAEMYPNEKKCIVFQPHLFSRTRDFIDGFSKSLAQFDDVYLLDIYPAREKPMDGVDSKWLLDRVLKFKSNANIKLITKAEIVAAIKVSGLRVNLLVGAGDIGVEVESITKSLMHEN